MRIYYHQNLKPQLKSDQLPQFDQMLLRLQHLQLEMIHDLNQFLREEKKKATTSQDASQATCFIYLLSEEGLKLNRYIMGRLEGSIYIDFTNYQFQQKIKSLSQKSQPFIKALGARSPMDFVVDATCGLGQDSFLMLALKLKVHGIERNKFVYPLLEDAYDRALGDPRVGPHFKERFTIESGNAIEILSQLKEKKPKVIYLDPMFPQKDKAALSKGEMEIFKNLVGPDQDFGQLLEVAKKVATERVVVKRPSSLKRSEGTDQVFEGKLINYEVYLKSRNP